MDYIKLYEDYNTQYLYHGTSYDNAINIIENGFIEKTYWGDKDTATDYAYSYENPVLLKVPLFEIEKIIEPNYTLIDYWKDNQDEDDDNIYEEWEESGKTPMDSYSIFGSVILPPTNLILSKNNIVTLY